MNKWLQYLLLFIGLGKSNYLPFTEHVYSHYNSNIYNSTNNDPYMSRPLLITKPMNFKTMDELTNYIYPFTSKNYYHSVW